LSPPRLDIGGRTRGFTLLEALVALAVMAAALAAIGQLGYGALAAARRAQIRLELVSATRAALSALPDRAAARDGVTTGEIFRDRWRLVSNRLVEAATGGSTNSGWIPQILKLDVADGSGALVTVYTVRLRRGAQ
jgi:general secretion pathway protein I